MENSGRSELLLSLVGHELGNALTIIKGSAQMLAHSLCKHQAVRLDQYAQEQGVQYQLALVRAILHRTRSMEELISRLLAVSRLQSRPLALQDTQQANLVALVRSVVEQYQAASQHRLMLEASEEAVFAACDAFWIEQVLHNLVGNALKYSPPNTTVVVGVER